MIGEGDSEHDNEATIAGMFRMPPPPENIDPECYRLLNAPSLTELYVIFEEWL